MKAKDETEDGMQIVTIPKKQVIAKLLFKRIDKITREIQFYDQNENLILGLQCHNPKNKDQFGRYKDDNAEFKIFEGNIFIYQGCERHENYLGRFTCFFNAFERMNW